MPGNIHSESVDGMPLRTPSSYVSPAMSRSSSNSSTGSTPGRLKMHVSFDLLDQTPGESFSRLSSDAKSATRLPSNEGHRHSSMEGKSFSRLQSDASQISRVSSDASHLVRLPSDGSQLSRTLSEGKPTISVEGLERRASSSGSSAGVPPIRAQLIEMLKANDVMTHLTEQQLHEVLEKFKHFKCSEGKMLFTSGDIGNRLIMLKKGSVKLLVGKATIAARDKGELVGEESVFGMAAFKMRYGSKNQQGVISTKGICCACIADAIAGQGCEGYELSLRDLLPILHNNLRMMRALQVASFATLNCALRGGSLTAQSALRGELVAFPVVGQAPRDAWRLEQEGGSSSRDLLNDKDGNQQSIFSALSVSLADILSPLTTPAACGGMGWGGIFGVEYSKGANDSMLSRTSREGAEHDPNNFLNNLCRPFTVNQSDFHVPHTEVETFEEWRNRRAEERPPAMKMPLSNNLLHKAARDGIPSTMAYLLSQGDAHTLVHYVDLYGRTALQFAAMSGNVDCVKMLLFHKADVSVRNLDGTTAAGVAAQEYDEFMKSSPYTASPDLSPRGVILRLLMMHELKLNPDDMFYIEKTAKADAGREPSGEQLYEYAGGRLSNKHGKIATVHVHAANHVKKPPRRNSKARV